MHVAQSLVHISLVRAFAESSIAYVPTVIAYEMDTPEIALLLGVLTTLVGGLVWLVRLEGRLDVTIAMHTSEALQRQADLAAVTHRLDRISTAVGVVE